ncbi:hypothetical protein [Christiangramia sediminis]|uniref:Uncharacterized protein n=1 Tax=Christiangramia sediminis TaxID=2881336 RepID=A0A9X1LKN7_9FLAO|nr:hypothetical protein [Christiangramia sediminis]MCB7482131.1 hypothetical protein [Christiangramia sediminis]
MKSKTNIFLLISFLVAIILTGWLNYQAKNRIGDLSENKEQDHDFQVCNEDRITQYYGMDTDFEGGKRAIKNKIFPELEELNYKGSGLITFRFIVNCEGEIGRFRHKATDLDMEEMAISPANIEKIEGALLKLKNWNPASNDYNTYDSYYVLNFKIRNDKLVDIF